MKRIPLGLGVAIAVMAMTGCHKEPEVPLAQKSAPQTLELVKETERSRHFLAVSRQLELGGTLYGYVDVDGDVLKLAHGLHDGLGQVAEAQPQLAPFLKQDYAALFTTLGLTDIKAAGISSVPDGSGFFRNRVFFYTPENRQGLLAGLGGKSGPFTHVNLAPADADIYVESEVDMPVVYKTIKDVVAKVGGETSSNQLEDALKKAGESVALSVLDLIGDMKGRSAMVVRLDPSRSLRLAGPNGLNLPALSVLLCIDGVGQPVDVALQRSKSFTASTVGTLRVYQLSQPPPVEGIKPVVAIDGTTLYVATTIEFLNECRGQKSGLAEAPAFKQALTQVGSEGNGLSYVSPRFFSTLHQVETLNPQMPVQLKSTFHWVMGSLPKPDRPLITVRTNLPDGILIRSYWNRSLKQDVMMAAIYNPLTLGIVAAMAVPAFQKVRTASQEKAVLNNLRQLAAAADQYYLEHGVKTALYSDLVGPDKYVKVLTSVAGENYHLLVFQQGRPLVLRLADGRVIKYP